MAARNGTLQTIQAQKASLGLTPFETEIDAIHQPSTLPTDLTRERGTVNKGDVVCLPSGNSREWRKSSAKVWYAYVQGVHHQGKNLTLDMLWLFQPYDTINGAVTYPFPNELFLSDNCDCGSRAIDATQVLGTVKVHWHVRNPRNCLISLFAKSSGRCTRMIVTTLSP